MNQYFTHEDILHFLRQVYFGNYRNNPFQVASDRAYRDFCRTIRSKTFKTLSDEEKNSARIAVTNYIRERLAAIHFPEDDNQACFDIWHKETCDGIIRTFSLCDLTYGQAQKWLNMMFKYLLTLEQPEACRLINWLHIPFDYIIIKIAILQNVFERPRKAWSQWTYDEYTKYQSLLRNWIKNTKGKDFPPIIWEFRNWHNDA